MIAFSISALRATWSHSSARRLLTAMLLVTGTTTTYADNTIYVTTTEQEINDNGECSLQEAIYSANFDNNIAVVATNPDQFVTTACVAGNGHDTIVLPAGAVLPMSSIVDDAYNPFGPTATPIVTSAITIEANGARLEHVPNGVNFRAFAVGEPDEVFGPASLTIRHAWIRGFTTKGGNGAGGGGGGLGAGGAIYVSWSTLTIENSTFEGNGATGGNGSHNVGELDGGGGGGLGGNGGLPAGGGLPLGGGGGGGGARGDGGSGDVDFFAGGAGGGGGGTVTDGEGGDIDGDTTAGQLEGGFACGGAGGWTLIGFGGDDGEAGCFGGGGGGGESYRPVIGLLAFGNGGAGGYGGGGGGAGYDVANGGKGGFGGGGGSGTTDDSSLDGLGPDGGDGGYGGGGGAGHGGFISGAPGEGGGKFRGDRLGGDASKDNGGGGAALGGAIFSHRAAVTITNSTFAGNFVNRGLEGGPGAEPGRDAGGTIFSVGGSLTVLNTTLSGNASTGEGAGIVVHLPPDGEGGAEAQFMLRNTIIANSVPNVRSCFFDGSVDAQGSGNLIQSNFGCPGMAQTEDPELGALQLNAPGNTPTMEIQPTSVAADTADAATSLLTDQRGVTRPTNAGFDIGAFEARESAADLSLTKEALPATALPGDTIIFRLGVGNLGPDDASNVIVADTLPSGLAFVSCNTTAGTCGGTGNDRMVSYATLAASANHVIDLTTTLDFGVADGTVITNTASVSAASPADPTSANDTASASVTVQNKADLLLTQSVKKLTSRQLRYTVTVKNLGPYQARRIELNDPMPNGTKFVSASQGLWSCVPLPGGSVGTLSCSLPRLDFNGSATLVFTVKTTAPGSVDISNTATVAPATFDPNLANNSATLVTRVSGK